MQSSVYTSALPLTRSLNGSVPQFPHLESGSNTYTCVYACCATEMNECTSIAGLGLAQVLSQYQLLCGVVILMTKFRS